MKSIGQIARAVIVITTIIALAGCAAESAITYASSAKYADDRAQHDETIRNARLSTQFDPSYASGWYWLGVGNYRKGQYAEAVTALKKALALRLPQSQIQSAHDFLGWAYLQQNMHDEAIVELNKAVELAPTAQSPLGGRMQANYWKGNYGAVMKDAARYLELAPGSETPLIWRAWARYKLGDHQQAAADADAVLAVNPASESAYRVKGWSSYAFGRLKEAIEFHNASIEKNAGVSKFSLQDALRGKAFAYAGLGDGETAGSLIRAARSAYEYDSTHDLTLVYFAAGERDKAWQARGGRGMLGISVRDGRKGTRTGAEVQTTTAGSAAEKAGILPGDIVVSLNGEPISSAAELLIRARTLVPGSAAQVAVLREGMSRTVTVTVGSADEALEGDPLIAHLLKNKKKDIAAPAPKPSVVAAPVTTGAAPAEKLPAARQDAHALVIGIDYGGREDIPGLRFASADARKVHDALTDPRIGGIRKENAVLLVNEKATRNGIKSALRKIRGEQGLLFVYFSGHGAPKMKGETFVDAYIIPFDADITTADALDDTGIRLSEIEQIMNESPAKNVLVALDACFTGAGKSVMPKGGKPLVGMLADRPVAAPKGEGKVMITSSAANQQSWEDDREIGGGIFSHYLVSGMKGAADGNNDAWVTVDELAAFLAAAVSQSARKLKGESQTPQRIGSGDFRLSRNWERAKVLDAGLVRARLKAAFEHGALSAEQLNRALDEISAPARSKTLDAFLGGVIDEKKFGELY